MVIIIWIFHKSILCTHLSHIETCMALFSYKVCKQHQFNHFEKL